MATVAEVRLWGRTIGAVSLEDGARAAAFQYEPAFVSSRIELSPLVMPLSAGVYRSEEHTSELQSRVDLVCRLLLEKKKKKSIKAVASMPYNNQSRREVVWVSTQIL